MAAIKRWCKRNIQERFGARDDAGSNDNRKEGNELVHSGNDECSKSCN